MKSSSSSPSGSVAVMHLGVHAGDRAGQDQGLVGQVAAEVQQRAAARGGRSGLGPEPLEARLEDGQRAECALAEELAHGQEVRIPATVLVHGEGDLELLGELDGGAGGLGIRRERLVGDDRQAQAQRLLGERDAGGRRGGNSHRFSSRAGQVLQRGEGREAEVLGDLALAFRRGGDHPEELAIRGRGDQRGVKIPAAEAVAGQADADRYGHDGAPPNLGSAAGNIGTRCRFPARLTAIPSV